MLLLGTGPTVGVCVSYCLQLVGWIYSKAPNFTSDPSRTHPRTRLRKVRSLSL